MKTEYQGRGTPHWHIAAWVVCFTVLRSLEGNTGKRIISAFVRFLQLVFACEIDVQVGNGRLNYINGYVAKDHDAVDVGLGEYVQSASTAPWLASYRLLSKSTPCIPEVAIRMASLSEFERSYSHVLLYPPPPSECVSLELRKRNFTTRMYGIYLGEVVTVVEAGHCVEESFRGNVYLYIFFYIYIHESLLFTFFHDAHEFYVNFICCFLASWFSWEVLKMTSILIKDVAH